MKILVTEDDFASRNVLQLTLRDLGEVDLAVDGEEALAACSEAFRCGEPYDLILMDIMMPEKDGLEAAREIRQMERKNGIRPRDEAKILMVTAFSDVKTVFKAFNSSEVSGYLVKPFVPEDVLKKLAELGVEV